MRFCAAPADNVGTLEVPTTFALAANRRCCAGSSQLPSIGSDNCQKFRQFFSRKIRFLVHTVPRTKTLGVESSDTERWNFRRHPEQLDFPCGVNITLLLFYPLPTPLLTTYLQRKLTS